MLVGLVLRANQGRSDGDAEAILFQGSLYTSHLEA